ncbi:MAG TPA: ATP-binding protein [Acidimicrobiales bacterium]|nr:ATP-binding protein [Acidimicrobiales bacterium]
MTRQDRKAGAVIRSALRPPLREPRFWVIQAMIVMLAGAHLFVDLHASIESQLIPVGIPVVLLLAPVSYAAVCFGLSGAAATATWGIVLWLPDLLLPHGKGHIGNDLVELLAVAGAALFVGYRVESERRAVMRVRHAETERHATEVRYHQLFDVNTAPILVVDDSGMVRDANPAAAVLRPPSGDVLGRGIVEVLGETDEALLSAANQAPLLVHLAGREFRVRVAEVDTGVGGSLLQIVLDDVTDERMERSRVRRYAALVVGAQEKERRRLARELHDEPVQRLVHLARRLDRLRTMSNVPVAVTEGLSEARQRTLEVLEHLQAVTTGLRPPALDQLGLVPAVRGLLAGIEDETSLRSELCVEGVAARVEEEVELTLFRTIQEALNNVVRHADATSVAVRLAFDPEVHAVRVEVADDGRGFDPERKGTDVEDTDLGLLGMRERVDLLGGIVEVVSAPGKGTVVRATVPTR